jgi:small subunit ribosomal protein S9
MSAVIKETVIEVKETGAIKREKKVDAFGRAYATGKRKNAIAKVWIKKGSGKVVVNDRQELQYFGREILVNIAKAPFGAVKAVNKFDVVAQIVGGGKSGQAGALSHGISKALVAFDPENHPALRAGGFLTRDSRVVERKKYGLKKARKGQTYRKR